MKVQSLSLWAPLTHKTSLCFRFTGGKNSAISCAFEISVRLILFFPAGPLSLVLENDSPLSSPYRHFNNSLTCHSLSFSSASSFLPPSWLPPSLACNLNILPFSSARTKLLRPHSLVFTQPAFSLSSGERERLRQREREIMSVKWREKKARAVMNKSCWTVR